MTCAPSSAHTRPANGRIAAAGDMLLVDGVAIALGASPVSVTLGRLVFPSNESSARSPRSPRTLLPRCDFFPQLLSAVRVPAGLALSHAEIESSMRKTTVRQVRPRGCAQRAPRRATPVRGRQILCDFPPTRNLKNRNWQKQRAGWWLRGGEGRGRGTHFPLRDECAPGPLTRSTGATGDESVLHTCQRWGSRSYTSSPQG